MARTGRPREFDREKALDAAMALFWAQGYEPTSVNQLKAVMGDISPASFYAAFRSKEALFSEVVQRYQAAYGQVTASLKADSLPPRAAIELALRRSAEMQADRSHPPGCLMTLAASNCTPENRHIDDILAAERAQNRKAIESCIDRAIANGDLSRDTPKQALATVFHTFLMGIAVETRDGAAADQMDAAIDALMQIWDLHTTV